MPSAYETAVLADSPAFYFRLGESSGTVMADSSGGGNNGTYINSPTLGVPGALIDDPNTAIGVTGNRVLPVGAINTAMDSYPNGRAALSIECWAKIPADDAGNFGVLVGWDFDAIGLWTNAAQPDSSFTTSGGGFDVNPDFSFPWDGAWHHIVITFLNGVGVFYFDGQMKDTAAASSGTTLVSSNAFGIGSGPFDGLQCDQTDGDIDEVAIYNTALTSAQVLAHYEAGTIAPPSGGGGGGWKFWGAVG